MHIFERPIYTVLLERPFDTLTESNVQNLKDGNVIITIHDPNSGKCMALPTYERGKMPVVVVEEEEKAKALMS